MTGRRAHEGYIMLDERAAGGRLIESASYTCPHCQRIETVDPLRQRDVRMCAKCDRYLCTRPECNGLECRSVKRRFSELQEADFLREQARRF